ncbi:MAG: alanine dehydrogenase [Chitinophagales bacterium]|nr:MAG: alanine dehydrogenase [Chitinophagales bacterium]
MTHKPVSGSIPSGHQVAYGLSPQEAPAQLKKQTSKLFIGIPKEKRFQEQRVPLTPESVSILVAHGHRIVIETKAGEGAHFKDRDYAEAGAEIAYDPKKVFDAEIILKVAPLSEEEISLLKMRQILISPIHLPTIKDDYLLKLMNKKITALALEYMKDESGTFPFVRSISEIAGNVVIAIAAEYLSNTNNGQGILLGGISGVPPAKVIILGAGVVGESATRAAIGLGAEVKIFDNNIYKLMRLQNNIGRKLYTSAIYPDVLLREISTADVVIGAIHSESGRSPIIVTEEMVSQMKRGAVIIDVSIDQGGVFETSEVTSHENPVFTKYDVIHYCVPNVASRVAKVASYAISNILYSRLLKSSEYGGFEKFLYHDAGSRHGVYIYHGSLTNKYLSEKFNLKYTDIDLLFTASM